MKRVRLAALLVAVIWSALATAQTYNSIWEASSGKLPDAICPAWKLYDTAEPEDPQLAGGVLTLNTSDTIEYMWYQQEQPELAIPNPWVIEFRMKWVSGELNVPMARTAMGVSFVPAYNTGNVLFIHQDTIFLFSPTGGIGPMAFVDTDNDFHTYRIEITNASAISVYQDNLPVLTGSTYYWSRWAFVKLWWGDGTGHAAGVSQWQYFKHNAYAFFGDADLDGFTDSCDNCPRIFNPTQSDSDQDGYGDACDDSCTRQKPGDVNNDGAIDNSDLTLLIGILNCMEPLPSPGANADFNGDCIIDTTDVNNLTTYLFIHFPPPAYCTCVNPDLHTTCSNMCDSSWTDPVFLICPGGDAPFRVYLRDAYGQPVVNDTSVYIQFGSCDGVMPCPVGKQGGKLRPVGPSDANGVVTFYFAGAGCDDLCTATIRCWCGPLAVVPVKSFDVDHDFGVTLGSDLVWTLCNDYNANGAVDLNDEALLDQHLGHYCGLTPCERFGYSFSLAPDDDLIPGQVVALNLALSNNNFDSCYVGTVSFFASGFGIGQGDIAIGSHPFNRKLGPGESDTVSLNYTVPGTGHGCLKAKFSTACCSTDVELVRCAQSNFQCNAGRSLCYQFNIRLNQFPVTAIERYGHLPTGWVAIDDHIPSVFPINSPDSIYYRICTPPLAEIGDTAAVYNYIYTANEPVPRVFVNRVATTSRTGDCDTSCSVDISDVVYVIGFIFASGPMPVPCQAGDVGCDGMVDISDAVFLIAYIFAGGPPPCIPEPGTPVPNCGQPGRRR